MRVVRFPLGVATGLLLLAACSSTSGGTPAPPAAPPPTSAPDTTAAAAPTTVPVTSVAAAQEPESLAGSTPCGVFNTLPQDAQVGLITEMMDDFGLSLDEGDVAGTYGSARSYCSFVPPEAPLQGIYAS